MARQAIRLGRMAKKEQDDLDRQMGEAILDAVAASEARRQGSAEDLLLKALNQAHQARASEAEDNHQ